VDDEGEAGETVVHVQCPNCKKLFEREQDDPYCPFCDHDTSKSPATAGARVKQHEDLGPKHLLLYFVLGLTIFTAAILVYYLITPDPETETANPKLSIGLVLFPFALCSILLVGLLFVILKRTRIKEGLKSKLVISGLLGVFISCLMIGVGKIGSIFTDEGYTGTWLRETETVHNLFIIIALFSLILLGGYFFYMNYQKKKEEKGD
jgi:hypothetical protein